MKNSHITIVLILMFMNCNSNKNETIKIQDNKLIDINILEEFQINDSNILLGYNFTSTFYSNDSTSFLLGLNSYYNKLEIIDLENKKVHNTINLIQDKFQIQNLKFDDFYVHSLDSLFMFSSENYKVALMDVKGNLKNVMDLTSAVNENQSEDFLQISTVSRRNIFFDASKNELVFRSVPPLNWYRDKEFYSKPFLSSYNISKNKFTSSFGAYPQGIRNNEKFATYDYQQAFCIDFKTNKYIVSNRTDHYIYEYDLYTNNLLGKKEGKSNYLNSFDLVPRSFDMQKVTNSLIKDGNYTNLIFNPYKDEYYRIIVHNQNLVNETSGRLNHAINGRKFSIVFLNENLEIIGEKIFENEKFNYLELTAVKNGLLINYKDDSNENINHFKIIDYMR